MTDKSVEQVREEYISKCKEARYVKMLASCNKLEQEIVKTLGLLDSQSGGKLDYLYQVYQAIKFSNK